jgi:hypothetical protein
LACYCSNAGFSYTFEQTGLVVPETEWIGVNRIIEELFQTPLSVGMIVIGIVVVWAGVSWAARIDGNLVELEKSERAG